MCIWITDQFPLCSQGYERVRRSSDEELYLLRAHEMEEGSSHSDFSTSGEHKTEEVSTTKQLNITVTIIIFNVLCQ